jgi:ATP-binding cassette subfamily B protein
MDRGRIVEIGSHDELMAREGHYFRLYQAQARNVDTEIVEIDRRQPEPKVANV